MIYARIKRNRVPRISSVWICAATAIFLCGLVGPSMSSSDSLGIGIAASSRDPATESYLRFFNASSGAGTVDVSIAELGTGKAFATWTSPAIPAGAAAQIPIATIEKAATSSFTKPSYYAVSAISRFQGYSQSIVYKPAEGALSNITSCSGGLAPAGTALPYVHSGLLSSGFPSRLVLNNTGASSASVTLGIYDEASGSKLGTYTTDPIAASGAVTLSVPQIEATAKITPSASQYRYIIRIESAFTGFAQHLVDNVKAGILSDITSQCALTPSTPLVPSIAFTGNVVLGSPTDSSIKVNVFSPDQAGTIYVAYGKNSGVYEQQTAQLDMAAGTPVELSLAGLLANTQYYYRLYYRSAPNAAFAAIDEHSFHTARPKGQTFTFAVQGDSHPERVRSMFDEALYTRTLTTVAADRPDFYVLLGDDFSVDNLSPATINQAEVRGRYTLQRPWLGLIGQNAPLFLVNGNHEQAARYLLDGTANNIAVWAQNARNTLYSQPGPDSFYTGNNETVPYIGLLRNYFAWSWGDALFVVIDPYWSSPVCVDEPFGGGQKRSNLWDVTHGDAQYEWLKRTLESSTAKYKFVFAHHVMGTQRGGIEIATLYEWGGNDNGGKSSFSKNRPTWSSPIHKLFADTHVTIFFQGHDHIWVHQTLDGVTYQTLPNPADPNYALNNADAYLSGVKLPSSGYARVSVNPAGVKVEYVRTYRPEDEGAGKTNGSVAESYNIQ